MKEKTFRVEVALTKPVLSKIDALAKSAHRSRKNYMEDVLLKIANGEIKTA